MEDEISRRRFVELGFIYTSKATLFGTAFLSQAAELLAQQSSGPIGRHARFDKPLTVLDEYPIIVDIAQVSRERPEHNVVQREIYDTIDEISAVYGRDFAIFEEVRNIDDERLLRNLKYDAFFPEPPRRTQTARFFEALPKSSAVYGGGLTAAIAHDANYDSIDSLADAVHDQHISIVVSRRPQKELADELGVSYVRATPHGINFKMA